MIVVGNGQRPMQLRRVEVEVRPEWVDAVAPMVEQLRASCGLQPAKLSKFEAGLLALGHEVPGSPDLGSTTISESSTMGDLAFAVLRRQLAVLREKEPGTRLGEDPEELHDMRVATRRLRAALALFAEVLPIRAQAFREELGWLGRLLGGVRDLDVQQEGLAEMATATVAWSAGARPLHHDPLAELTALLEAPDAARDAMLSGLDSVRFECLDRGSATMVQQGPACRSLAARVPAVIAVPDLVVARHGAVAKAAKRAKNQAWCLTSTASASAASGSATRSNFSSEVYGGRTARFVRQLTALQDELGLMQDAEVASIQLADLATGEAHLPPAPVFVMGGMAERHRRDVERFLRRLPKELPRIAGREWRDLLELMERRRVEAEAARPPVRGHLARCAATAVRARECGAARTDRGPIGSSGRARPASPLWGLRPSQARGNEPAPSPMTTLRVLGEDEVQLLGIEEALDVDPDVGEVRLRHVGPVLSRLSNHCTVTPSKPGSSSPV